MADSEQSVSAAKHTSTSEMDKIPREEEMLDLVKRRTKEIYRLKTGRASETANKSRIASDSERGSLEKDAGSRPIQTGSVGPGSDITLTGLWDKMSAMAEDNRKQVQSQTEIIANLAANFLAMQDMMNNSSKEKPQDNSKAADCNGNVINVNHHLNKQPSGSSKPTSNKQTSSSHIYEDITESEQSDVDIDGVMSDSSSSSSDDDFLNELEKEYETPNQFGEKIGEKLAAVTEKAVYKAISPDDLKKLTDKYLVPENCKSICVPKVNKEVWRSFKSKQQREPDLALQSVERCLSSTLVMVLRALELLKGKASQEEVKGVTKDMFKMLSHGLYTANRKRKMLITPGIPYKYRKVTDIDVQHTEYLFGDNLDSRVDEVEKEEKRAMKLSHDSFLERRKVGKPFPPPKKQNWNKKSKIFGHWRGSKASQGKVQKINQKQKKQHN